MRLCYSELWHAICSICTRACPLDLRDVAATGRITTSVACSQTIDTHVANLATQFPEFEASCSSFQGQHDSSALSLSIEQLTSTVHRHWKAVNATEFCYVFYIDISTTEALCSESSVANILSTTETVMAPVEPLPYQKDAVISSAQMQVPSKSFADAVR